MMGLFNKKTNKNEVKLEEKHFEEALRSFNRISDQLVIKKFLNRLSDILKKEKELKENELPKM